MAATTTPEDRRKFGHYRFKFLDEWTTFARLAKRLNASTRRLRDHWKRFGMPQAIVDPYFFAPALTSRTLVVTLGSLGTFRSTKAAAKSAGISTDSVFALVRKYGFVVPDSALRHRQKLSKEAKARALARKRSSREPNAPPTKRTVGNAEWNAFTDRPRATLQREPRTLY